MTHDAQRRFLLQTFLAELPRNRRPPVPDGAREQWLLLRGLMNTRPPRPLDRAALLVHDQFLREETRRKGITDPGALAPAEDRIFLWRGDITALRADAVVNAANSGLLGCFIPCHGCIDNAIHTFAGVELRLACAAHMARQGREEPSGRALLTPAFNLPSRYVIHTVGPAVSGSLTARDCALLEACYRACFACAAEHSLGSIAFCCISTGEFRFPAQRAAEIAVQTVRACLAETACNLKVIFNVYKKSDEQLYQSLLGRA